MSLTRIATKTFTAPLVSEGSWGATAIGTHQSSMDLYAGDDPNYFFIEWDIPDLEIVEHIGLWVEAGTRVLTDYDGLATLPVEATALLEANGFTVGEDFK